MTTASPGHRGASPPLSLSPLICLVALLAALVNPCGAQPQASEDPWARYVDALALHHQKDTAGAVAALMALVPTAPPDLASEALWEAARLQIEALGDMDAARVTLERLVADHPESVGAQRARGRLEWLRRQGDLTLAQALMRLQTASPEQLRAWAERWPDAAAVRFRLAEVAPESVEVLAPLTEDPELRWRALRARADGLHALGDISGAVEALEAAGDAPGLRRARLKLWLLRGYQGGATLVFAWMIIALARAGRRGRWWPAPVSVRYFAPVALACLLMAMPMTEAFASALITLAVGATLILWIAGAGPRSRRPWLAALVRVGVMGAFVYATIHHFDLWEQLWHTLKYGPER